MKATIFLFLMSLCIESLGAVIVIKGQPVPLVYTNDLYYLPLNFSISPGTKNLFITMDGVNKVCFLDTSPPGVLEQISEIRIVLNSVITEWNCFPYKTTILEVRP